MIKTERVVATDGYKEAEHGFINKHRSRLSYRNITYLQTRTLYDWDYLGACRTVVKDEIDIELKYM